MIKKILAFSVFVLPSLAAAVIVDLPAVGDLRQNLRAAIPIAQRYFDVEDRVLRVSGQLTLRLPKLDALGQGRFRRELDAILRDSPGFDFSRATIEVLDDPAAATAAPSLSPVRVVVPWPISLFYADKLGRTLRGQLPAEAMERGHVQHPLRILGDIVFDLSRVPEPRRADVESQIREVLQNPKKPGVKDPVDAAGANVTYTRFGGGTESGASFNVGTFAPLKYTFSTDDLNEFDPPVYADHAATPRPTFTRLVPRTRGATSAELAHQTVFEIAEAVVAGRVKGDRVTVYDASVNLESRAEFRRALIERWTEGVRVDGVAVDLSALRLNLVNIADHCGSTLED